MFECVAEAEQEEEERPFGPGAQGAGTCCCDEHQRVDLKAFQPKIVDRLPKREPTTENIGAKIAGERDPGRSRCQLLDGEPASKEGAADQREEKLGLGSKNSAEIGRAHV